jgi:hypothetical protein
VRLRGSQKSNDCSGFADGKGDGDGERDGQAVADRSSLALVVSEVGWMNTETVSLSSRAQGNPTQQGTQLTSTSKINKN